MSIEKLNQRLEKEMTHFGSTGHLEQVLTPGFADKRLYAIYLTETYHYTKHNARNQALVATRKENLPINYMKFCLKHAAEEVGHELMALHDLNYLGFKASESDLPLPLNSTQTLIAYLYYISENEKPVARLGYSFWAEKSYGFIKPLLGLLANKIGVEKNSMTFFNEHSEIDEQHSIEVEKTIERFAKTPEDWEAIEQVMTNSLTLTVAMMNEVLAEFIKMKNGEKTRYDFIK